MINLIQNLPQTSGTLRTSVWFRYLCMLLILLLVSLPGATAAQEDPARTFYRMINQARLDEGLPPLGWSTLLAQAAQRHADDMAENKRIEQTGSDGSTYQQRIREAGYRAWNNGLLVNESIWAGLGEAENALNWFREDPERWDMFIDERYREVGLGHARDEQGVNYYVIDFGSRPGVLPIFINDGAETTESPAVALRLTNEEAEPLGEGARIGKAIEVRVSNTPEFEGLDWQPWESLLPWELAGAEPDTYAVYVEFRDGAGRTTISEDTIRLVVDEDATPSAPPGETLPTPLPSNTPSPSTPTSTPIPATPEPSATETPATTEPPAAVGTPTVPAAPTDTPLPATAPVETPTAPPTWTPLPARVIDDESRATDWPLIAAFLLQGAALVLGIALFLRRR